MRAIIYVQIIFQWKDVKTASIDSPVFSVKYLFYFVNKWNEKAAMAWFSAAELNSKTITKPEMGFWKPPRPPHPSTPSPAKPSLTVTS